MALPEPVPSSTCLITGASSGIGADIARELAARGHAVTLVARREDRLKKLANELSVAHGVHAEVAACDVSDPRARERLVAGIEERNVDVEVLVNNAGFGTAGHFVDLDRDRELEMVRTNVEAVVDLCSTYVPQMVQRGRGAVLNVASVAAFQPLPRQATYAASKAFVLSFSEALHQELGDSAVSVTALCPGPVPTEFTEVAGIEAEIPPILATTAEENARAAVKAMEKGRRGVIPGPVNMVSAMSARVTPHSVLLPLLNRFYPVGK